MKIAVTFFNHQKKRIKRDDIQKIKNKMKYVDSIQNISKIKVKYGLVYMILVTIIVLSFKSVNTKLMFLGTNYNVVESVNISKQTMLATNSLYSVDNYVFNKIKEDVFVDVSQEYMAIDEMAQDFNVQTVFSSIDGGSENIVAENEVYQRLNVCGIEIVNYSSNRNIDFMSLIKDLNIGFNKSKDEILMYTTHTSESYASSEKYQINYSDSRRSTDGNFNMLTIASEFASNLNQKGISSICSLTPHDYGAYNSAYMNSRKTATDIINSNPDIKMVIDVHRDAIENLDFAPKAELKGYNVASLMFVMGIGYDDGDNPYYEENLKLALKIQLLANKIYPGLFRSMIIRNSVYNQDLKENSFLIEVGASGNTIDEALLSTRCLANLINILFKD